MKMRARKRMKYRRRRIWDLTFTFTEVQNQNVRLFHSSWLPVSLLRRHLMEIQGMTVIKDTLPCVPPSWDCSTDDHDMKFIAGDPSVGEGDYVECRHCDYSRAAADDEIADSYADPEDY